MAARKSAGAKRIVDEIRRSDAKRIKVAVSDIDGVLRGKYLHKDKFLSAVESGLGFCNVVLGWDMNDTCYDNTSWTGWHTGFPDATVQLDLASYRRVPWDDDVPFFLGDFVEPSGAPRPGLPAPGMQARAGARRQGRFQGAHGASNTNGSISAKRRRASPPKATCARRRSRRACSAIRCCAPTRTASSSRR